MTVLFYRRDSAEADLHEGLPVGVTAQLWQPSEDGLPPRTPYRRINRAWWAIERLGLFARPAFAEIALWQEGRILHRLIVTPRWYRFPFMAPDDLQVGDLWTRPDVRGRGLARAALAEAHRYAAGRAERLWYVVDADNRASIGLVEACGYHLVGRGHRTGGPAGRFRLDGAPA